MRPTAGGGASTSSALVLLASGSAITTAPSCAGVVILEGSGESGFDERLGWLRHGKNSGYAATHLAAQLGARTIVLVGFDFRAVDGRSHFFGDHPLELSLAVQAPPDYAKWAMAFRGSRP